MGKKQHSKDRMFITTTEWATEWGGAKRKDLKIPFQRLPFYCCAISFTPFEDPVCTEEGDVFDILNIIPYIQKFGKNPVSGGHITLKDLIKLNFNKNTDGEYCCPVLGKVFTEFTHIIAIKTTGNVFSYEAVKELNLKPKFFKDLLNDVAFTRDDIITIQDPNKLDARVLTEFDFVKKNIDVEDEETKKAKQDISYKIRLNDDTKRIMDDLLKGKGKEELMAGGGGKKSKNEHLAALANLEKRKKEEEKEKEGEEGEGDGTGEEKGEGAKKTEGKGKGRVERRKKGGKERKGMEEMKAPALSVVDMASASVFGRNKGAALNDSVEKTHAKIKNHYSGDRTLVDGNTKMVQSAYTSGKASRSFTSTLFFPVTKNEFEMVKVEKNPKKKGYVRLNLNLGDLNFELHCDLAPRACENFITHCENGFYDNTIFHRSIRNFMIQGGDPTGSGTGGKSIWEKNFKDEFHSKLLHSERGVLSMANSGPHTNGSQFFILYKSAPHLNNKHTVFGRLVGGFDVLKILENVAVDQEDRPLEEIRIEKATVFSNPYTEMDEEEKIKEEEEEKKKTKVLTFEEEEENSKIGSWFSNPSQFDESTLKNENGTFGIGKYLLKNTPQTPKFDESNFVTQQKDSVHVPKKQKKLSGQFGDFSGW